MTTIVKTISRWVKVLILLFGIYVVVFGDLTPGGGFAGGVVIACSYVLLMLAFGREYLEKIFPPALAFRLLCAGTLVFVSVALAGLIYGLFVEPSEATGFFWNFIYQKNLFGHRVELLKAGIIPLAELAIGLIVSSGLFLVIFKLSAFRPEYESNKEVS